MKVTYNKKFVALRDIAFGKIVVAAGEIFTLVDAQKQGNVIWLAAQTSQGVWEAGFSIPKGTKIKKESDLHKFVELLAIPHHEGLELITIIKF